MGETPRDPLAEHPFGGDEPSRRMKSGRTLDLFPDIGQAPLAGEARAERTTESRTEAEERRPVREAVGPAAPDFAPAPRRAPGTDPTPAGASGEPVDAVAFARRVAASLADLLILALVGAVVLTAGALVLELRFPPDALLWAGAFLALVSLVLLVLAPFVWGATPGMALADLRILAPDGGSPTLAAAALRFVGFALTLLFAGVPLLVAAFDRRSRTLADLISGTTVAGAERPAPSA